MTDAAPAAPVVSARRPRRVWDLVLTIVLLVAYLGITLLAATVGASLTFARGDCGISSVCDDGRLGLGVILAGYGVFAPVLVVVIVSIVLLALRRRAFWVPLAGILLAIALVVTGSALVLSA